ncbi:uncharacterized protein [Lolium perenne]|uniref:uncharacterized protein n=1 Tax=Lolium perenne TaxID=4522 RepID=UPI003A99936C
MSSSSSSSASSSLSFQSSSSSELIPEHDLMAQYEKEAPGHWDDEEWDFTVRVNDDLPLVAVGSDDDLSLTDGEQQDGPEPVHEDGSSFKFLPPAPVGYDLSSLLTFDPESIEPATSRASEEPGPSTTHGQLQRLRALLSSSIETLIENPEEVKGEKDELNRQHQDELNALKTSYQDLKSQLIQLGLDHAKALKAAEVSAAAKLDEALEDASNATVVLRAELEEMAKARKGAEEKAARLEEERKECDQLILQTDTLALRLFPDSQRYAVKKVDAQRKDKGQADLTVPWTPKDHLVALNARVSHMRCIDRNLSDIPDVATQLYRTLWPGEAVPDTFSLISDRLKGAGRRIREWQCSAARAGADSALRVACSWYPELNLDALTGVREEAETDLDPILSAKRQDRAYRIAEYADMRTFIPPPPGVTDYLDEEEGEAEEEVLGDADAGAAPPEAPAA